MRPPRRARAGFTLAEVAVTLMIVSLAIVTILQGLTTVKHSAAETHHRKVAMELGMLTLGRLEAGLYREDLEASGSRGDVLAGTYAEEGYEEFSYELVLGEQQFSEELDETRAPGAYHDTWTHAREPEEEDQDDDEEENEVAEPFEKARIRVTFPKLSEAENHLVIERWIPWELVYGSESEGTGSSGTGSGTSGEGEDTE